MIGRREANAGFGANMEDVLEAYQRPLRLVDEESLLKQYVEPAKATPNVTFVGQLGTYRYLDMDVTIGEALTAADRMLAIVAADGQIPAFFVSP